MVRRAEWRVRPEDPKTIWGWIARDDGPRLSDWRVFVLFCLAIILLAYSWSPFALLAVPLLVLNFRLRERVPADLSELKTIPPPGPSFEVRLAIERGSENVVIGLDEGVVTFVEGWLHYAGQHTDFSIRAKDVRGFSDPWPKVRVLLSDVTIDLRLPTPKPEDDFRKASQVWYQSSVAEGDDSVMPPNTVHASGLGGAWARLFRAVSIGLIVTVFVGILLSKMSTSVWFYMGSVPFATGFGDAFVKLKGLRKSHRQEKKSLSNVSKPAIGP